MSNPAQPLPPPGVALLDLPHPRHSTHVQNVALRTHQPAKIVGHNLKFFLRGKRCIRHMSDTAHTPSKHAVSPELGPLLKRWRKRIDHRRITGIDSTRRRLKPGLTQDEVASLTGVASSWYRQLEGGSPRPVSEQFVQRLAMTLRLKEAERVSSRSATRLRRPGQRRTPRPMRICSQCSTRSCLIRPMSRTSGGTSSPITSPRRTGSPGCHMSRT
ncbi:helix-turn-helix domain-containing protein [Streptomyces sp. NBC_00056]|uniref:helix-turn-helix domain-containing protein n=1 Tax=Streptomyces sp. NBC_00056 TaxID=2975633 RepID=UPI003869B6F2